jgi:hypothetical protein
LIGLRTAGRSASSLVANAVAAALASEIAKEYPPRPSTSVRFSLNLDSFLFSLLVAVYNLQIAVLTSASAFRSHRLASPNYWVWLQSSPPGSNWGAGGVVFRQRAVFVRRTGNQCFFQNKIRTKLA